jgi:hypothetical protein
MTLNPGLDSGCGYLVRNSVLVLKPGILESQLLPVQPKPLIADMRISPLSHFFGFCLISD